MNVKMSLWYPCVQSCANPFDLDKLAHLAVNMKMNAEIIPKKAGDALEALPLTYM